MKTTTRTHSKRQRIAATARPASTAGLLSALFLIAALLDIVQAAPGDLDPTFGNGGKVTTDFGSNTFAQAFALAVQTDGRIVVAGLSEPCAVCHSDFALARYQIDGSLDTSFGSGGKVTTGFGGL